MSWRVWGHELETSDLTSPNKSVRLKPNSNLLCTAMRTWLIFYNDPTFTNLTMKVYSDINSLPGGLIASSTTTHTKAEIITLANGVKEVYFEFENLALQEGTFYHFVLQGTGYTYNYGSHIAWRHAYPDPVYTTNLTVTYTGFGYMPYSSYIIGAQF